MNQVFYIFMCSDLFLEPNNDSPLNGDAAALWPNQEAYKTVLLEKYEKDVRSKQS